MKKVKVLHLIKTLNLGGAGANLFNLVQSINSDLFEVHVGYSLGGQFEDRFKDSGIKLFKYAESSHKVKSLMSILIVFRLVKYVLKNNIAIIHTHTFNAHVWGAIAAKLVGIKVVEHVHDPRYEEPFFLEKRGANPKQFKYSKYFANLSNVIIVLTESNRKFLLEKNICSDEKIKVVLNGIDLEMQLNFPINAVAIREKLNIPKNKRVIMSAGRIEFEKNFKIIIRIAEQIRKKYKNIIFIIAGEGPLKLQLKEEVKNKRLEEAVKFIGFYPDIKGLLRMADMFILPSLRELHSITVLEAMSMRVVVLASKVAGRNDDFITHGVNGFLLDPNNIKEWCDTINLLLKNEKLLKSIANNGRKLVEEKCDIRKTAKTFEIIYSLLARKIDRLYTK